MHVEDEELMAYLDGELPPERAEEIARQIATSPSLRAREAEMRMLLGDTTAAFARLRPTDAILPQVVDLRAAGAGAAPNAPPARTNTIDLAAARVARSTRPGYATFAGWRRAAAILLVVGGAGVVTDRVLRPASGSEAVLASDPALRDAMQTPAAGRGGGLAAGAARATGGAIAGGARPAQPAHGEPAANYVLDVTSSAARVVASNDVGGAAPSGRKELRTSDGTRLEFAYGETAVQGGGRVVEPNAASLGEGGTTAGAPPLGDGVRALHDARPTPVASGESPCATPIRWRDPATGVELRLAGPLSCERLTALAARLSVRLQPR